MLNEQQHAAFQHEAIALSNGKFDEGWMATDLVALGYYLIKQHLPSAKKMEQLDNDVQRMLKEAEALLGDIKNQTPR